MLAGRSSAAGESYRTLPPPELSPSRPFRRLFWPVLAAALIAAVGLTVMSRAPHVAEWAAAFAPRPLPAAGPLRPAHVLPKPAEPGNRFATALQVYQDYPRVTTSNGDDSEGEIERKRRRKYSEYDESEEEALRAAKKQKQRGAAADASSDSELDDSSGEPESSQDNSGELSSQEQSEDGDYRPRKDREEERQEGSSESSEELFEDA
eukprot:EG_transcript_25869